MSDILSRITFNPLPSDQFIDEEVKKDQIILHHTAGSADPFGVLGWWRSTPDRIATAFIIGGPAPANARWHDGQIVQCFNSSKWAWHLGPNSVVVPNRRSPRLQNAMSIGIEICNWGWVRKTDKGFVSYSGARVPDDQVFEMEQPWKGHRFWHKYSDAQIQSTRDLLVYLCDRWKIDPKFKGMRIFDIDAGCMRGENGIFTHNCSRKDKVDIWPYPPMIEMLKSL